MDTTTRTACRAALRSAKILIAEFDQPHAKGMIVGVLGPAARVLEVMLLADGVPGVEPETTEQFCDDLRTLLITRQQPTVTALAAGYEHHHGATAAARYRAELDARLR